MSLTPNRAVLVMLQIAGSLSVLAYPAVLLASVMSLAAPGQSVVGAAVSILPMIYPLIWGEAQNPAAAASLARMFDRVPDLEQTYGRR